MYKNDLGFTKKEQQVMNKLMETYNLFLKIEHQHPDEIRNFVDGVHRIQEVLGLRVLRRSFSKGWPTYINKNNKWIKKDV